MADPGQERPLTDEELEIQMAIALSLQEVHASQLTDPPVASSQPVITSTSGPSAPAPQQPAAVPADTRTQLQSLLAQALSSAIQGSGGSTSATFPGAPATAAPAPQPPVPAPAAPLPQPVAPGPSQGPAGGSGAVSNASNTAAELARQFALFQQSFAAAGGVVPTGAPAPPAHTAAPAARPSAVRPASARAAPAPVSKAVAPTWAAGLSTWWAPAGSTAAVPHDVNLASPAELQVFLALLSSVLNTKVVASNDTSGTQGLILKVNSPGTTPVVKGGDLSGLLGMWLRRPSMVAAGTNQLRALHNVFDALTGAAAATGAPAGAVAVVAGHVGSLAFQLLSTDEEDLYFTGGQYTSALLKDLKTPHRQGAGMCAGFMDAVLGAVTDREGAAAAVKLLRTVLSEASTITRLGSSAVELEPLALSLDVATSPPVVQRCLVEVLLQECLSTPQPTPRTPNAGKALEAASCLSPLLQLSACVDAASVLTGHVSGRAAGTVRDVKGFPTNEGEINTALAVIGYNAARAQDVVHGLLKRLVTLKDGLPAPGLGREVVLAWLAGAARANWDRTAAGERGIAARIAQEVTTGASDGWCVNVTAVCLRFSRPFVEGYWDTSAGKFADLFTRHLHPGYYWTSPHRTPDLTACNSLAGERGRSCADGAGEQGHPLAPPAQPAWLPAALPTPAPSFIADCFFLTQTWLHVGLLPALYRYQRLSESLRNRLQHEGGQGVDPRALSHHPVMAELCVLGGCQRAALLDPRMVEDTVQFCLLQISWLHHWLGQPGAAGLFSVIPDYTLSDPLTWLTFVITSGLAVHVASKDISALTSALAALLDAPTCVRSPVLADKAARLLLAMLAPQLGVGKRAAGGGRGALAPTLQRPGEAALVAGVLNSPASRSGALVASLMRAYVAADHVVGLDVDRDSFDKFTMRNCIDTILSEVWQDERGRGAILALAAGTTPACSAPAPPHQSSSRPPAFHEYVSCLFNSLIYLFKDSLDRLVDIAKVEAAKADTQGWSARPAEERERQEGFLRSQAHTCRGFMRIALHSLHWLNTLATSPQAGGALCSPPLVGRVAYSCLLFSELLTNTRAQGLQVERPEQYSWDRLSLLGQVVQLMTSLARVTPSPAAVPAASDAAGVQPSGLVAALLQEPDLDLGLLQQARDQLEAAHRVTEADGLKRLIASLAPAPAGLPGGVPGGSGSAVTAPPPAKRSRVDGSSGSGGEPGPGTASMDVDGDTSAAAASHQLPLAPLPPPELSGEALSAAYSAELSALQCATFDSTAPRGYHSAFLTMDADSAGGGAPAMMKRVAKEVRDVSSGRTPLPLSPAASVFLRYDGDHMTRQRALITGPEDTPYAYGCFVFDLLFPPGYPTTPMLVNFETTGQGRARFNPNLYADGKVCLSLINTWHASHESEKWNPASTTAYQVLVSIQAMILIEDPYYNEPAHEATRGTDTGKSSAAAYNAALTLNTIRWSMIDKLRHPPPGLEEVVICHFRLLRHKVMATAQAWAAAADATGDESLGRRTHAAVRELRDLLAAL